MFANGTIACTVRKLPLSPNSTICPRLELISPMTSPKMNNDDIDDDNGDDDIIVVIIIISLVSDDDVYVNNSNSNDNQ